MGPGCATGLPIRADLWFLEVDNCARHETSLTGEKSYLEEFRSMRNLTL